MMYHQVPTSISKYLIQKKRHLQNRLEERTDDKASPGNIPVVKADSKLLIEKNLQVKDSSKQKGKQPANKNPPKPR